MVGLLDEIDRSIRCQYCDHCRLAPTKTGIAPPFFPHDPYSAKRGLAIACRLSVRLSVTLVDHDNTG